MSDRLTVRNFPEGIKEWADRRNMNMSDETRRMWQERIHSPDAGTAAMRSELAEKRAALEAVEERAAELREEIDRLEVTLETVDSTPDGLDAALREKPVLVPDTPAVERIAVDYGVPPERVLERHAELHDTGGNDATSTAD